MERNIKFKKNVNIVDENKIKNKMKRFKDNISEKILENILMKNLDKIERGMQLITNQYTVNGGVIDILARDINNVLTVIELKVQSDCKDVIFQCLYYPSQFNEDVRMITIAPSYSLPIYKTLKRISNVEVLSYYLDKKDNLLISKFKLKEEGIL